MADVRRTIELVFGAVDQTSAVLSGMGNSLDGFADRIEKTTQPIADFTTGLLKIEGAILGVAAVLGGIAIAKASEFQDATLELTRVLGQGEGNIEDFQAAAIGLSDQFGISASEVLSSTASFRQAGFAGAEALGLVEQAIIAVKTTELESQQASEVFIRLLAGFQLPATEASRALDILNGVSANFATSVPQLAEAMARAAPVASTLGFSMEELAGFLTPVISVFQSGEIAGRAFSSTMQRLVSDNSQVALGLEALGVSQTAANGQLKSGVDILTEVGNAFQAVDQSQQIVIATQLAGTDQAAKMVQVFKNLEEVTKVIDVANNSAGSSQAELDLAMQSTTLQSERMQESFNNAAIAIGSKLRPEYTKLLESLGNTGTAIREAVEAGDLDALFGFLNNGFQAIGEAASGFATNLSFALQLVDFGPLLDALRSLTGLADDALTFDLSNPQQLAELIQTAVDTLTSLVSVTEGVVAGLSPLFKGVGLLIDGFNSLDPSTQKIVGLFLGLSTSLNAVVPLLRATSGAAGLLSAAMGGATGVVAGTKAFGAHLATVGGLLAGSAGTAALVGGASFFVAEWAAEQFGLNDYLSQFTVRLQESSTNLPEQRRQLEALGIGTKDVSAETRGLSEAEATLAPKIVEGTALFDAWSKVAENLGGKLIITKDGLAEISVEAEAAASAMEKSLVAIKTAGEDLRNVGVSAELAEKGFAILAAEGAALGGVITNITPETSALIKETENLTESEKEAAEETARLRREAQELELEFAKLASSEREVFFKVAGDIQVAQIQAQAEQVVAAFESISQSVESTTNLIGDLTGLLGGVSGRDQRIIEETLKKQLKLQEEALEAQKELIDAQVDFLKESANQLARGESQITITADGLEPEIEAFMFRIVEKVRIKANAQGQSFLLGLPSMGI